ncbi:MAG: permease [bacterium]
MMLQVLALNPFYYFRRYGARIFISVSLFILLADTIYKTYFGISYQTRQNCILYGELPRWLFQVYENLIELSLVVIFGILLAVIIERYFFRIQKIIPKNTVTAFFYASVLPVCSCSVVPLIKAMTEKVPFRVIITFVIAAPLLNPYIIMLSLSVIGWQYTLLRIIFAFILSVSAGFVLEWFGKKKNIDHTAIAQSCGPNKKCSFFREHILDETFSVYKKIFPFILLAGFLSITFELTISKNILAGINLENNFLGNMLVIITGIPMYFCSGADVLFVSPLMKFAHLPLGTALAFSMTSTSVCASSLIMLIKYIGKKLTIVLIAWVMISTVLTGILINFAVGAN